MSLISRHEPITIPDYSLTGDLLSYLRCGLQYRYINGSALPPARPVQLWFGEFIHGVMEMAFTMWKAKQYPLPWKYTEIDWDKRETGIGLSENDIGEIGRRIESSLAVQGKIPRNKAARLTAYERAAAAVNLIGPDLFPLVEFAEEPLSGSRLLPDSALTLRAERYGLTGVVDVLTHISLGKVDEKNHIRHAVEKALKSQGLEVPEEFEVVVDYKGSARPPIGHTRADYWQQHDWQVQTYAWLRSRRPEALPVVAGVILYVNELLPNGGDIHKLKAQINKGSTDVTPSPGSKDFHVLNVWKDTVHAGDILSEEFRIERAIRVIPVTEESIKTACEEFDNIVLEIETKITTEINVGDVSKVWTPHCNDGETCSACDFRYSCAKPFGAPDGYVPEPPRAP